MGVKLEDVPFQQFRRHFVYELTPGSLIFLSDFKIKS
jgi:hypothetical protein